MNWKYEIIPLEGNSSDWNKKLNEFGQDGWETIYIFEHSSPRKFMGVAQAKWFAVLKKQVSSEVSE